MQTTGLGKTGTMLPKIGLGTWQYGGSAALLRMGIELGATFIDTAESYGTEGIVGEAIKGRRHDIFLATKALPRHFRWHDLVSAAEASLGRLGTDYIDLYQLHWPNYTIPIAETMEAMESLVESGKIRFIGVSNFMLRDLQNAQKALTKARIVSNQLRYNLIDRTIDQGLLQYCQNEGITVIAYSPFGTSVSKIRANDPRGLIGRLAEQKSRTVGQIVLNWCISRKGVVTIPKSESITHVRENCSATEFELSAEEVNELDNGLAYRRRGHVEMWLRRLTRHTLQSVGRNQ